MLVIFPIRWQDACEKKGIHLKSFGNKLSKSSNIKD